MKILIAEDDSTSRTLLTGVLRKFGHDVVATEDGAKALHAMQLPDAPKLAIIDWMMPELDGLEVCRRLRALKTDQPGSSTPGSRSAGALLKCMEN
jgi:CheY-like chemotaxis protein